MPLESASGYHAAVSTRTDFDLLEAWRAGDREAGGELFDRHLSAVSRFFKNKVDGNTEDLVQETFLACVEGRDRFEGRSSFRTYLFGVARNLLLAHYRRRHKAFDPLESSVCAMGGGASSAYAKNEEQRLMLRALRELPVDQQIALELYYWEQMQGPQLAEVLDISPHTVRSRLSRARSALREKIQQLADNPAMSESTLAEVDALAVRLGDRAGRG